MTLRQRIWYGLAVAAIAAFATGYFISYITGTVVGAAIYIVSWAPLGTLNNQGSETSPAPELPLTDRIYFWALLAGAGLCIGLVCAAAGATVEKLMRA